MRSILVFSFCILLFACQTEKEVVPPPKPYLRWVGDIEENPALDSKDFKLCNGDKNAYQYFNTSLGFQYKGEKKKVIETFQQQYRPVKGNKESGMIRIRFLVNCKGEAGRFRVLEADQNYQKTKFDDKIVQQLLDITKQLDGWVPMADKGVPIDYYLYLTFIIENGNIKSILP